MEGKVFMTVEDIAADLSISEGEAADLLKELQRRLKAMEKFIIAGRVPAAWYEEQKESGFMEKAERIPLTERRLLSIAEFRIYAGGISDGTARKHIKEIGAAVRIGDRLLADRVKFDQWCDQNRQQGQQ